MEILACVNGEILPADQAKVSIWDRGFVFGDSVYEVFRLYDGRCWLEDQHIARLKRSLKELDFVPHDLNRLMERSYRTIEASGIREGMLYLQITRGAALRSHPFPDPPVEPTEVIVVRPYDDAKTSAARREGVRLISLPDLRWKRCDIKTTNLLANVLANEAAKRAGAFEAVLVDSSGYVTESTHTSLLWYRGGRLEGTPEGDEILPGTTRQFTLTLAEKLEIPFKECRVTLDELLNAEEIILVGTTTEVVSVTRINETTIGGGRTGPIAAKLHAAYEDAVKAWLAEGPRPRNQPVADDSRGR